MFREERTFKNSRGLKIAAIYEGKNKNAPVVIICHGYGSNKTRISTRSLAKKLVNTGFCVYRFDFTGCGRSQGKLQGLSLLSGLDDLKSAVKNLDRENFALFGSSFGGAVSLMYAGKNPVMALALKAPVSDYLWLVKFAPEEAEIKESDTAEEAKKIDLYELAKNIKCPSFIAHGDADDVVPLAHSKKLLKYLGANNKSLKIIPGAPHVLRGKYLSSSNTLVANFFKQTLLK